ncbi:MAG TPA: hypothetical protein PK453_03290 [Leptospiraceae bacterium]|nr:hypothetical protein [Leptospiraceae bacterium]
MEKLLEHIDQIQGTGSFCTGGILDSCMPGISIKGYGEISLPLQEKELPNLEKFFSPAPYGKGEETLVDRNVRSTKELNPERFSLNNPEWKTSMDKAVQETALRLGLGKSKINYSLCKLLLYSEGDFFLPHRDTEKETGMFATMVIALPSVHSGGDLLVTHNGRTEKFSFSSRKYLYQAGYAAFYADCEHEVGRIKKGARLCLVYSLKMADLKTPPDLQSQSYQIELAEALLRKARMKTDKAFFLLEHKYTQRSFSKKSLKSSDIARAEILFQSAEKTGYSAHLALVTLNRTHDLQSNYDDFFEVDEAGGLIDSVLTADCWFDSEGRPASFGKMGIEESEIYSSRPFGEGEADETEKEEYTGNAGATVDLWYRRAAVVLWKKKKHFSILAKGLDRDAAGALLLKHLKSSSSEYDREDLISFAYDIIKEWKQDLLSGSVSLQNRMLSSLNILSDADLTKEFFREVLAFSYGKGSAKNISESLYHHGIENFNDELRIFVRADSDKLKTDFPELLFYLVQSAEKSPKGMKTCRGLGRDYLSSLSKADRKISERKGGKKAMPQNEEDEPEAHPARNFSLEGVCFTLVSLIRLDSENLIGKIIKHFIKYPKIYSAEKLLAPALLKMEGDVLKKSDSLQSLSRYCIEILKEKSVPPREPSDWRQETVIQCSCRDCQALNQFIQDPDLKIFKISASKDRRRHLHRQVDNYNCDMTHVTDRKTSPETLIFTKTTRAYDRKMKIADTNQKLLSGLRKKLRK